MADGPEMMTMPGHLIRRLHQRSTALFAEALAEVDDRLTPVQFAALSALDHAPGMDQATLAATIGYDRATIGGVVDRLSARGLVQREVSEADRRARVLALTDEGRAVLRRARPAVNTVQARLMEPLSGADRVTFLRLLRQTAMPD